jgi:hypothetical protein
MKTAIAAIMLIASTSASAVDFDISLGQTMYDKSGNGQWWQSGLDNKFQLQSNSIGFGFSGDVTETSRWRVGYINLGQMSSSAIATTDANYNGGTGCIGTCVASNVFIGKGNVEGISLTIAPSYSIGKVKGFVEFGAWGYIPHFNMVVYDTNGGAGNTVKVWDKDTDDHMQFGPILGVGVEYEKVQLVATLYTTQASNVQSDTVPNWGDRTLNVSVRKVF